MIYGEDYRVLCAHQLPKESTLVDAAGTMRQSDSVRPATEEICLKFAPGGWIRPSSMLRLPLCDSVVIDNNAGEACRITRERRKHPRFKLRVPVELRTEGNESPIAIETADLSLGGLYVETMFTWEIGTRLDITLRIGNSTVPAVGEVVTCDRNIGNGIRFVRMLPEDREELERFLQAVAEKQEMDARPKRKSDSR